MKQFEEIEHTADLSLRIWGADFAELIINAGYGMNSLMMQSAIQAVPAVPGNNSEERLLELEAVDRESLMVAWLSELAYLAETEMMLGLDFRIVNLTDTHLKVAVLVCPEASIERLIKAVTYHDLVITSCSEGLVAQVVFDV